VRNFILKIIQMPPGL